MQLTMNQTLAIAQGMVEQNYEIARILYYAGKWESAKEAQELAYSSAQILQEMADAK